MDLISLDDFSADLRMRPALCIGSRITAPQFDKERVLRNLIDYYAKNTVNEEFLNKYSIEVILDDIKNEHPHQYEDIFSAYKDKIRSIKPTIEIEKIAKSGWSTCISLTDDIVFETALSNHMDHVASSRTVTEISDASILIPERTIPVYKLMGQINYINHESALAVTESEFVDREQQWTSLLSSFPDFVKGGLLLFLGVSGCERQVRSLLTVLRQMPSPKITRIAFLESDQVWKDPTIKAILKSFKIQIINTSIVDITTAIQDFHPIQLSSMTGLNSINSLKKLSIEFSDLFYSIQKQSIHDGDLEKIRPELVDVLFRPASVDFRPYWYGMDLRRTITTEIISKIKYELEKTNYVNSVPVILRGEAGIGKTTVLKRVAIELVDDGYAVFWFQRGNAHGWSQRLREFVSLTKKISEQLKQEIKGLIIICDDPVALRISNSELVEVISRINFPTQIVLSVRNSEFFISESEFQANLEHGDTIIELPVTLDTSEIDDLVNLLLDIGAVHNKEDAIKIVDCRNNNSGHGKYNADDILCSLWYLVPETQQQLSDSLRDEYLRLGAADESIKGLAANAANSGRVAKAAYELVTVISNLDLAIPMEVLVHAVQVNFDDWIEMLESGRPLWGLLYDEISEAEDTIVYHTRNNVVTKLLLKIVNGGVGHAGEFRVLKQIISSCSSSSPIYREFLVQILVGKRRELEKTLNFEQGDELFKLAKLNIGFPDKILEHHHGVWMHHKGKNLTKAYNQLEISLNCSDYPSTEKKGKNSYIKTSQAAVIVQKIKNGEQNPETGIELIKNLLREISQTGASDPYSSHIHASSLFDLAQQQEFYNNNPELARITISNALSEIQQALQRIGIRGGRQRTKSIKGIEALSMLRRKIIESIDNLDEIQKIADEMFSKTGCQDGFRVYFQILFSMAASTEKGKDYNIAYQYIDMIINRCEESNHPPLLDLYADRADIAIRWQVHGMKSEIDWYKLRSDLKKILESSYHSDDVIRQFYYAVSIYHCGEPSEANAIFAGIRRKNLDSSAFPWLVRCAYLGKEGEPKRFQGTVNGRAGSIYVAINELEDTVKVSHDSSIKGIGSTVHIYVGFSLKGTVILKNKPEIGYFELP